MGLAAGDKIGPYEVISPLGEGGMGEVYRARDTRLGRFVALKVICLTNSDANAQRRFEQEARSIAALNHPNILAIYDVGSENNTPYLVTELLEGETLRERLAQGALPLRRVIDIATQIAKALSAAHDRGIIHRDLKPENIFLTRDGHTKLLDFGLARAQGAMAVAGTSSSWNIETRRTAPGTVLGTVGYMSPEQVRGQVADHRSDIFSFGSVLYEMLTGNRAFTGDSAVETMNAILKSEPPEIDTTQLRVSPGLERILRHCLEKSATDRFQSAPDLTFALDWLSGSAASVSLPVSDPRSRKRKTWPWIIGAVALVLLAALAYPLWISRRAGAGVERLDFTIPVQAEVSHIALSSDGRMLAFISPDEATGRGVLFIQQVGSASATRISDTAGAAYPFWSPDNEYLAFFAGGKLKKVSANGGAPQVLASVTSARGGSWGRRGVIIYAPSASGPLWRVEADGSNSAPLTESVVGSGESSHRWPVFLPDGEHFVFWAGNFNESPDDKVSGIYLSDLAGKQKRLIVLARSNPGLAAHDLVFVDTKGALVANSIRLPQGELDGKPRVLADQVGRHPSTYWGAFSVAQNNTVVYHRGTGAPLSQLAWFDRNGRELGRIGEPGIIANPSISPDGTRLTYDLADPRASNVDVWTYNLRNGTSARFTFDPTEETTGIWSRDGKQIAYRSDPQNNALRLKDSSGLASEIPILRSGENLSVDAKPTVDTLPNSWSLDGKTLLATRQQSDGGTALVLVSKADGSVTPFLTENGGRRNGQISPDGQWAAYESNETGDWEVFITTFPKPAGKLQVSHAGGKQPRWRGDGKEIYYLDSEDRLVAVPVSTDPALSTGTPETLFASHARPYVSSTDFFTYDVTRDGRRFLVDIYVKPDQIQPLNIILNATAPSR